jgi:hypothetical protein
LPSPVYNKVQANNRIESNDYPGEVYSNILWWNDIKVYSDNITIIAWESNTVNPNNADATVLWWKENILSEGNWSRTAILVWWHINHINSSNGWVGIIWWRNNNVEWSATDVVILWWEGNMIEWNSVIVWWSKVNVSSAVSDVFAFSDGGKSLNITSAQEWSQAFYLEVSNGVWINADSSTNWIDAWWAVEFGVVNLDENDYKCNSNNYGLQWTYNGCLMWCTKEGWELLDASENCKKLCDRSDVWCDVDCEKTPNHPRCPQPTDVVCMW